MQPVRLLVAHVLRVENGRLAFGQRAQHGDGRNEIRRADGVHLRAHQVAGLGKGDHGVKELPFVNFLRFVINIIIIYTMLLGTEKKGNLARKAGNFLPKVLA